MEDLLLLASADFADYPLWMLFNVERLRQTGDLQKSLPFHPDDNGEPFAPVFTDKDLAARFVDENPLDRTCELMPVESASRLRYLLGLYLKGGVKNVGTDFASRKFGESARRGQLRTIESFLKETEER